MKTDQPDDHHGVNDTGDHLHENRAKYLFPMGDNIDRPHRWYSEERLAKHLAEYHLDGSDPVRHTGRDRVKDPDVNRAKRIDVHPWALERWNDAEVIFFALESMPKADSILSHIRRHELRASVFSVPSVTLWDCKELHAFAQQYLRGRTVILVPDSDWDDPMTEGAVISQALYCREYLRRILPLSRIEIGAPTQKPDGRKRGIDDWLRDGNKLIRLQIIDRRTIPGLDRWDSPAPYVSGRARDTRILRFLALHAQEETGEYKAPLSTIARRALGGDSSAQRTSVQEALLNLADGNVITTDIPLRLAEYMDKKTGERRKGKWRPWPKWNPYDFRGHFVNEIAWANTPTLMVTSLLLLPTDRSKTLSDVLKTDI